MNSNGVKTAISKILIVDDHSETRQMMRFFLGDAGFYFEECEDGADALDCYEKTRPDWVLMDWEIRRMNGLEATRRIIEKHPQAKILMVTQYDDEYLKEAAIKAGAKGFILKENLLDLRRLLLNANRIRLKKGETAARHELKTLTSKNDLFKTGEII